MSPPDSEGKCQCQHCDGKQSVRECLCDSEGVTSTMDSLRFKGEIKSPETSSQSNQPFQELRLWVGKQQAGGDLASATPQDNFDAEGEKKKNTAKTTTICQRITMNSRIEKIKAKLIWSLEVKIKEKMTINTCLPDFTIYCLQISWSPVNNILL